MNSVACPEGSITNAYLLNRFNIIAFSVHKSSAGNALTVQRSRSSAFDKYYDDRALIRIQSCVIIQTSDLAKSCLKETLASFK